MDVHTNEFIQVKELISNHILLNTYDPTKQTFLQTDGSKDGLGFVLYQKDTENNHSIVAVDSRTTKETQKLYSPIKLEALAVRFALDKSQFYLLGPTIYYH